MKKALKQAQAAARAGEVPVGAVIVKDDKVIARGFNLRERMKDPCAHAELLAIRRAAKRLNGWRLTGCTLYVTLEPCAMCSGAIINSRIERVIFGAYDPKSGSLGSLLNLNDYPYNHHPMIVGGICENESSQLLKEFFAKKRTSKKEN